MTERPTVPVPFVEENFFTVSLLLKLILLAVGGYITWSWSIKNKKRYILPPGPRNYPVLGCIPLLDHKAPIKTFSEWAKKYGQLYYCKIGKDKVVVVNDPVMVRAVFSNDTCQDRPENLGAMFRKAESGGHCGLIFASGMEWKEHRRFVLRSLKDFGVGRRSIEDKVAEEAEYLTKKFRETAGKPFDTKLLLSTAVANVIANIVWDERYSVEDPAFQELQESVACLFRTSFSSTMINTYAWLRFVPPFRSTFLMFDRAAKIIASYFTTQAKDHLATWTPHNDRDMIDAYISSLKKSEFKSFDMKQLAFMCEDLMEAGFETTTTALRWAFLLMCAYPEVQKKVQAELDSEIHEGTTAKPTDKLPYTEAVLAEVQRFASFIPFGVMHEAGVDIQLGGYDIPAKTWILPNVYYIHHDEKLWEDPFEFKPERFLSPAGVFSEPDFYIPFSVGKRRCPGEALARTELLIFFTTVLKNLTLSIPPGSPVNLDSIAGATLDTSPHKLIAMPR